MERTKKKIDMDYEQKYKEALKDMRVIYPNLRGDAKLAAEHAFPELQESGDKWFIKELQGFLESYGKLKNFHISCSYDELRSWVRSLKSRTRKQPLWKPSEEQMEALSQIVQQFKPDKELESLYNDLKKLI